MDVLYFVLEPCRLRSPAGPDLAAGFFAAGMVFPIVALQGRVRAHLASGLRAGASLPFMTHVFPIESSHAPSATAALELAAGLRLLNTDNTAT